MLSYGERKWITKNSSPNKRNETAAMDLKSKDDSALHSLSLLYNEILNTEYSEREHKVKANESKNLKTGEAV